MALDGLTVIAPLLGLIVGSFLGALTYRLPRGKSVADGRSECPACHTPLTALDLVPVVSWLVAGGKCRHCGAPVSPRYPLIETSTALVFLAAALVGASAFEIGLLAMAGAFLIAGLVLWLEQKWTNWAIWLPVLVLALSAGLTRQFF